MSEVTIIMPGRDSLGRFLPGFPHNSGRKRSEETRQKINKSKRNGYPNKKLENSLRLLFNNGIKPKPDHTHTASWKEATSYRQRGNNWLRISLWRLFKSEKIRFTEEHKVKIGLALKAYYENEVSPLKGVKHSEQHSERISRSLREYYKNGGVAPLKGKRFTTEHRVRISKAASHPKPPKNGYRVYTDEQLHWDHRYKQWRRRVIELACHTCAICGQTEGTMEAHHIRSALLFPSERYDIHNGRCLCPECHNTWHLIFGTLCRNLEKDRKWCYVGQNGVTQVSNTEREEA